MHRHVSNILWDEINGCINRVLSEVKGKRLFDFFVRALHCTGLHCAVLLRLLGTVEISLTRLIECRYAAVGVDKLVYFESVRLAYCSRVCAFAAIDVLSYGKIIIKGGVDQQK